MACLEQLSGTGLKLLEQITTRMSIVFYRQNPLIHPSKRDAYGDFNHFLGNNLAAHQAAGRHFEIKLKIRFS